jgi:uncharacterized membrane protein
MSSPTLPRSFRLQSELTGPLLAGCLLFVASWLFVSFLPSFRIWLFGDVTLYETWGNMMAGHQIPYRDFRIEYPPFALPVLVVPVYLRKLAGYHGTYFEWFRIELLVIGLLVQVAVAYALAGLRVSRGRAYAALGIAGLGPVLLGPIALSRYDYWPTLFAMAAVAALVRRRPTLACAFIAVGTAAKVYPIVLLPLALIELWRWGRARAVARGVGVTAAVLGVLVVPFAAIAPDGLSWALERQLSRPLQVESLGAVVFGMAHVIAGVHLHVVKRAGSDNLVGGGPDVASVLLAVATFVALLGVYWLYLRSAGTPEQLVVACAAAVTAYIAFSKVFSPQYLVWLIPLVPLVRGRVASALLVVIVVMTQWWEPWKYADYYREFPPGLTTLVLVRNLLVVALLVVLLRALRSDRDAEELDRARTAVF